MPREAPKPRLDLMETDRPTRRSNPGTVAVLVVLTVVLLVTGGVGPARQIVPIVIVALAITLSVGASLRTRTQRREYEHQLTAWAGERAAQAERLRLARELHDLVSHGLGLITVRAATARAVGAGDDEEQLAALADIERTSRETTTELRRMLTILRTPAPGHATDAAPLRPVESLAELPAIVQTARDAGLEVTLDLPALGAISPGAQLTACAIVREALHNALRHAGPTHVDVCLHRDGDALVASIRDDGPVTGWTSRPGAGHGLAGLRERLTALGGDLRTDVSGRGFTLTAHIPDEATG
jgi:two-component system sensor histidine kinase DesK